MTAGMTAASLRADSDSYRGRGGTSEESAGCGFRPAFLDADTQRVYPARYGDGRPAPCHVIDGLPDEIVAARDLHGRVTTLKQSIIAGFLRGGRFYTRDEAATVVAAA